MPIFRLQRTVRRPRQWWAPSVTNVYRAANQTFISANGGDSAWLGVADFRVGVNNDGTGLASQWDDVRGPGSGKLVALTQSTQAKRPQITSGGLVFSAASQTSLMSALDSRIALNGSGNVTILIVAKSPSGSAFLLTLSQDPTDTTSRPYMAVLTNASKWGGQSNLTAAGTTNQAVYDGGVPFNSTPRGLRFTKRKTISGFTGDTIFEMQVAGWLARWKPGPITLSPDASASGMKLAVGMFGSTYMDATVQWLAVTTADWTTTLQANWEAFIDVQFGAGVSDAPAKVYVEDDDSVTRGHHTTHPHGVNGVDDGTTSPPYITANISPTFAASGLDAADIDAINIACNGRTLLQSIAMFPVHQAPRFVARRAGRPQLLVSGPFINPFRASGDYSGVGGLATAQTDFAAYAALVDASYATKWIVPTCIDWSEFYTATFTGTINQSGANASGFNAWLRSTGQFISSKIVLCDYDALDPTLLRFQINRAGTHACADTTYYIGGGDSHLTDAGASLRGTFIRQVIDDADLLNLQTIATRSRRLVLGLLGM